jgi:hypothetical protein
MNDDQLIRKLLKIATQLGEEKHPLCNELQDLALEIVNRFARFKRDLRK